MVIFKGKKYRPEFADGFFPNGSLVTMIDSG
jgi:hypothetical protein